MTAFFLAIARLWGAIPARVQHYLEIGVVFVIALSWWTVHFEHKAVAHYFAGLKAQSAKIEAAAEAKIASLNQQYAAGVAAREAQHATDIKNLTATHASELERLRAADAARQARAVLDSSASGREAQRAEDERRLVSLERVAADLADALREEQANLFVCQADRDSLTGK